MNISVRWLNEYLRPADVTASGAEEVLTNVGFPIDQVIQRDDGDVMLDVEVTSNRGDGLSHIGLAREIAAATGRSLVKPRIAVSTTAAPAAAPSDVARAVTLENRIPADCPRFTVRVIKGVKVGPSPDWMVRALEAVGQRSINNVVDVTNYVMFEYGQPSHVFDLATIARGRDGRPGLIVRHAESGERLDLLDGQRVTLRRGDLVVADHERPVSLAGVMGGADTQVTADTVDVLLEVATWAPLKVRAAARRLNLRTDASHRFERIVDPRTIDEAAARAASLLVELAGGEILEGMLDEGAEPAPASIVRLRPARCFALLGITLPLEEMEHLLRAHEIDVVRRGTGADAVFECTIPPHRPDLAREVDLIEEVARTHGLDELPLHDKLAIRVAAPQTSERAKRTLASALTGLGFYEAITFTFVSPKAAAPFLSPGLQALQVCDERRKAEPVLRPSVIPSLLACRRANQDGGVRAEGGLRLYEIAPAFAADEAGREREYASLALLADLPPASLAGSSKAFDRQQAALRLIRGTIETAARALGGPAARIDLAPVDLPMAAYEKGAGAEVLLNGRRIGICGLISRSVLAQHDLREPVVTAEVELAPLITLFPPRATVQTLPAFPGIERDVSLIVAEDITWASIQQLLDGTPLPLLEAHDFVASFRGKPIDPGRKSITVRLRFRDPARTLRHEEVDPQVEAFINAARQQLSAELRT